MADNSDTPIVILSRDAILAAQDLTRELVAVPEWGGHVYIRSLTGAERDKFEADISGTKRGSTDLNLANLRARLVALTLVDSEGKRMFRGPGDVEQLGSKSSIALMRCFEKARELSGMTQAEVEELAKNSETPEADGSFDSD